MLPLLLLAAACGGPSQPRTLPADPPGVSRPAYAELASAEDTRWRQMLMAVTAALSPAHPDLSWQRRALAAGQAPDALARAYAARLPGWTPQPVRAPGGWAFAFASGDRVVALFGPPPTPGRATPVGIVTNLAVE